MLKYMLDGGPLMWALLALSIVGLAVILERWHVFQLASQDTAPMRRMLYQLLAAGKVDDAIRLCEETRGPVAAVLLVGLNRLRKLSGQGRPPAEVEASVSTCMGDYAPHVIAALDTRISLLLLSSRLLVDFFRNLIKRLCKLFFFSLNVFNILTFE